MSGPLNEQEINLLAGYNAERYRGLVHTAEYAEEMRVLQARFDDWHRLHSVRADLQERLQP